LSSLCKTTEKREKEGNRDFKKSCQKLLVECRVLLMHEQKIEEGKNCKEISHNELKKTLQQKLLHLIAICVSGSQ
jgi:alkylhydroperoxidase/carboxymuconolactone decarboxylase family protein YurZ